MSFPEKIESMKVTFCEVIRITMSPLFLEKLQSVKMMLYEKCKKTIY